MPKNINCNTPANLYNYYAGASSDFPAAFPLTTTTTCAWNLTDISAAVGSYGTGYIGKALSSAQSAGSTPSFGFAAPFATVMQVGSSFVAVGDVCIEQWPRTFAIPVIALIFITLLNDGTIISIAYDHAEPSKFPEKWNLPVSYIISSTLGAVAFGGSILYLHLMLDSHNPNGAWRQWGLGPLLYGHVASGIYLKVSLSDFLTLFSARTTSWFGSVKPDYKLVLAAFFALGSSTILTSQWPTPLNEKPLDDLSKFGTSNKNYLSAAHSAVGNLCSGAQPSNPKTSGAYKYSFCQSGSSESLKTTQSDLLAFYSGTRMNGVPDYLLGATWLYVFIWWFVQDAVKIALYVALRKTGLIARRDLMDTVSTAAMVAQANELHTPKASEGSTH